MKTAIYSCIFTLVSLWSLVAFGQGSCHNGGGYPGGGYPDNGYPGGVGGSPYPEFEHYDIAKGLPYFQKQPPTSNIVPISQTKTVAPAGPTAKITLISVNSTDSLAKSKSTAKLTIVPDVVPAEPKTTEVAVEEPPVDERIASLAGTWKAVARRGEGELTTVELRLDDRGWAELIVPGNDGEPKSTKSRVNLENQELRLTNSDRVVSLGKLVEFGSRQMVLERAEGQMTFVKI